MKNLPIVFEYIEYVEKSIDENQVQKIISVQKYKSDQVKLMKHHKPIIKL
ncbi:hypothetical protein SAMN04489761_3392 [Tenacibaculum sp. MAR_2009_124]|nr:hypothetical protein SAMN04489761_3392 [Tenacibaculum sp. MAR_2009_124]